MSGNSPNAVNRPFVATKTLPFATSGAAHFAAKSMASLAPAAWLPPSHLKGQVGCVKSMEHPRSPATVSKRVEITRSMAHRMPFVLPLAERLNVAPG